MTIQRKPIIGLIGGIGAGKSTVAAAFAARGGALINADKLGHEALEEPAVKEAIVERWGKSVLNPDGIVNRRAIANVVFGNASERAALEAMVFPSIRRRAETLIEAANANPSIPFIVLDAAVMLEAGWNDVCSYLVFVDAPRATRLARLSARSGWTPEQVTDREAAQLPLTEKRLRANAIVGNDGPPSQLEHQIDALMTQWGLTQALSMA